MIASNLIRSGRAMNNRAYYRCDLRHLRLVPAQPTDPSSLGRISPEDFQASVNHTRKRARGRDEVSSGMFQLCRLERR
jgi:hypothetical protein